MITAKQARDETVSLEEVIVDQYLPVIESLIKDECKFGETAARLNVTKLRQVEIDRLITELKFRGFEADQRRTELPGLQLEDYIWISWKAKK